MEKKFKYTKGWVILDFPCDINLAKIFEVNFTGYLSKKDKIN